MSEHSDADIAAARKAIEPHIVSLYTQRDRLLAKGLEPIRIEFPRWFPDIFDGGYVLGLPVLRSDVLWPTVLAPDHD